MRIRQFEQRLFNLKCPRCRIWLNGINIKLLTGEIQTDIDFRSNGKAVMDEEDPEALINCRIKAIVLFKAVYVTKWNAALFGAIEQRGEIAEPI